MKKKKTKQKSEEIRADEGDEFGFEVPPPPPPTLGERISVKALSLVVVVTLVVIVVGFVFADWYLCLPQGVAATYVGRQSCIDCHVQQGEDYFDSHHDLAMDLATPESVKAAFDGRTIEHDGLESRVYMKDDKYFVWTEGPDGEMQEFEVKYVFGTEPLQQYMVEMDSEENLEEAEIGQVQVLRLSWDTEKEDWFYLRPPDVDDKLESDDPLHWTRSTQCWNTSCADCHSTNLHKNYDEKKQQFHTTFSEMDVSCEACHGPGSLHVELAKTNSLFWDRRYGYGLAELKSEDSHVEIETCARCHSRRRVLEPGSLPGDSFEDGFALELLSPQTYHADGQILDEVYVYGSYIQSKMYHKGIRCTDCHDPHKAKLKYTGNALCTNCHQNQHPSSVYDNPSHHFHKADSTGSSCVECHMPASVYMDVDSRRDHSLRVPRPDLSVELGTPNACTQCHISDTRLTEAETDGLELYQDWLLAAREGNETIREELKRLDQWAADAVEEWYGPKERGPSVATVLKRAWEGDESVEDELTKMLGSPEVAGMMRASAAQQLANFESPESLNTAIGLLSESDPKIVVAALSRLDTELRRMLPAIDGPGGYDRTKSVVEEILPLLSHPKLAVRVEAALVLSGLGAQRSRLIRGDEEKRFEEAVEELQASIWTQNDRAGSYVGLGLLYENLGEFDRAINTYRTGIKVDPTIVGPRSNLANILEQRADEMVQQVQRAVQQMQFNPNTSQAIRAELEQVAEAETKLRAEVARLRSEELPLLAKDAERSPDIAFVQYRYGMLLYLNGQPDEAEIALRKAWNLEPANIDYRFAIALLEKAKGEWAKVFSHCRELLENDPENRQYQMLLQEAQSELGLSGTGG